MKTMLKYLPAAALIALLGVSCSNKFDYGYQASQSNVYFDYEKDRGKMKTLSYNFFDDMSSTEHLFQIPVRISGPRVDYDRTFKVVAQPAPAELPKETEYAVAGTHYTMPAQGVIPAGEGVGYVELTLLNTDASMAESYFQLSLDLQANADFGVEYAGKPTDANATGLNTVTVTFSQKLTEPTWWGGWSSRLKPWKDSAGNSPGSTTYELFRLITGEKDLVASGLPGYQSSLALIDYFTSVIKDPSSFAAEHNAVITPDGLTVFGRPRYSIKFDGVEKLYYFCDGTSTCEWLYPPTGLYSIFY